MLQEAIDLQQRAVGMLVEQLNRRNELTFRAPTGSGKTRMMADMMNRVLAGHPEVVFLVSTLSKGDLARQNYSSFEQWAREGTFPHLRPHLISTDISGEERLHIPEGCNVYVLARDLYKKGGRLMQGAMQEWLMNTVLIDSHPIYLVKDECHQATNNLDTLATGFFRKTLNFSATPNLKRGQTPDVEITDEEAEQACLIKHVEMGSEEETVEDAVTRLEEIKEQYRNLLGVNPCLIIQIRNKEKAEEEWAKIQAVLGAHQELKWMSIMDKEKMCQSNDKVAMLPVRRWKEYARENNSTIDVIVFKMVISEGWDIPRACMLYQVRDTQSRQLDEQVVGRVRRNPRLADFERLPEAARRLAMTAWVWGVVPEGKRRSHKVKLQLDELPYDVRVKTTRLRQLTERKDFDVEALLAAKGNWDAATGIFELHRRLQQSEADVQELCYRYAGNDVQRWLHFCRNLEKVRKAYNEYVCDYGQSMEAGREVSFPMTSYYTDNKNYVRIGEWVWRRSDAEDKFSFDSEAEQDWAMKLQQLAAKAAALSGVENLSDRRLQLWGKNFIPNSDIRFEYYLDGVHSSYPDFVMKDRKGKIHIFEVKSVNGGAGNFDSEKYKKKVGELEECYRHCSRLTGQVFYLPVQKGDTWQIKRLADGEEDTLSYEQFEKAMLSQ